MNYRLRRGDEELGVFPLAGLQAWRTAGDLNGTEWVAPETGSDWQTLDQLLTGGVPPRPSQPPPLPVSNRRPGLLWGAIALVAVVLFVGLGAAGVMFVRVIKQQRTVQATPVARSEEGREIASQAIVWSTNTMTMKDAQRQAREFRIRQYLNAYDRCADHTSSCDKESRQLIERWIDSNFGGSANTNLPPLDVLVSRLAANPDCRDPIALLAVAASTEELHEQGRRFLKALAAFEGTSYPAYPRFFVRVSLLNSSQPMPRDTDAEAQLLFHKMRTDGSLTEEDQAELAEVFLHGWAQPYFNRNRAWMVGLNRPWMVEPKTEAKTLPWFHLVLLGEHHVTEAWKARGSGFANSVTQEGWQGFRDHLDQAEAAFTKAWKLRPDLPLAPSRMVYVAMGNGGADEMRLWFDRTLAAQVDHPGAWSSMRWGLRPRWHGSEAALLGLGKAALETGRFDTDVPRKLFDVIGDLKGEAGLPYGEFLFDRPDIWPLLQRMYEGYIAAPAQASTQAGWRSTYAAVAHLAGHDDVARAQLEAVEWKPWTSNFANWGWDFSLLPEQVAAQSGPAASDALKAEQAYQEGKLAVAAQRFKSLIARVAGDERARRFVQSRLATIDAEQRLASGEWVNLLPQGTNDLTWEVLLGEVLGASAKGLEIKANSRGHLLRSRVRVGGSFAVRGEFEVVETSTSDFQAGIAFGLPETGYEQWQSFRVKRNATQKDVGSIGVAWTRNQAVEQAAVHAATNSFDLTKMGESASATINGLGVFHNVPLSKRIKVPAERTVLGIGAYNDMNDTVICYRRLEVRKL